MLKTKRICSTSNASFAAVSLVNETIIQVDVVLNNGEPSANVIYFDSETNLVDAFAEFNQIKKNIKSVTDYDDDKAEVIEGKQFAFDTKKHTLDFVYLRDENQLRLSFLDGVIADIKYSSAEDAEKDYKKLQNFLVKLEKE